MIDSGSRRGEVGEGGGVTSLEGAAWRVGVLGEKKEEDRAGQTKPGGGVGDRRETKMLHPSII